VVLMRWAGRGARGRVEHRELALEDFYTGYRKNVLRPDELLAWIKVPRSRPAYPTGRLGASGEWTRVYKVSKRWDDDISAVCLAISLQIEQGVVKRASLGAGGVSATPARAAGAEAALLGHGWNADTVRRAMVALREGFQPISDMRASAQYRSEVLANLLWRCWLESSTPEGSLVISLERLPPALLQGSAPAEVAQ